MQAGEVEYYKNLDSFNIMKNRATKELKQAESQILTAEKELKEQEAQLSQLRLSLNHITDKEEKAKTLSIIDSGEKKIESKNF